MFRRGIKIVLVVTALMAPMAPTALTAQESVRFGRDVLPILSANCFSCHGPDEGARQSGLRLDIEAEAKAKRARGFPIVPGQPDQSLMIVRLKSANPNVVMPPPSSHRHVTPDQIEIIRRWIADGAKWGRHWSFEPVVRPQTAAGRQPIDSLVSAVLAKKGLSLRPAASPQTLVRRLWLDLVGLPPTPEIADRFAAQSSTSAYERMVDELLGKPQFGEHWARMWLDLARYADTKGYEKDLGRTMWPYRDWVVSALNADMPLDRFTTEQLAGDLLPNPDKSQLIATAFHRNTMSNDEGGTDDEEFRVAAVKDRVDTTVQVWMGLTMGCAKCHSHKYDPISHADYYKFYALFNQTEDADRYDDAPRMELMSTEEQAERTRLQDRIKTISTDLTSNEEAADKASESEERRWRIARPQSAVSKDGATLTLQDDGAVSAGGKSPPEDTYVVTYALPAGIYTSMRLETLPEKLSTGQLAVGREGNSDFVLSELRAEAIVSDAAKPLKLARARSDFASEKGAVAASIDGNEKTGWSISPRTHEKHAAIFDFEPVLKLASAATLRVTISQQFGDSFTLRRFRLSTSSEDPLLLKAPSGSPSVRKLRDALSGAYDEQKNFNERIVRLPIMRELPGDKRRETKIHRRGNFLDPGDAVTPAVPAAFGPIPTGMPLNRLGVAAWLVNRDNPLTPRVWANRIWARLSGIGIVETEEDFGALGSPPSNPELLDWLAAEYRDNGWSIKKIIKTIVMSDTYRQASDITPALLDADPRDLIQSRGSRYRLGAEVVRDQALSVAGMLSMKMGGPPVMPPQPAGLWRSTYSGKTWIDARGEDRFRRGLYTYLKRTTPYPSMITFDGGSGEVCQIRRLRTNTPLQALVTLNDPVYLEAAGGLARRMLAEATTTKARALRGLRLALIRTVSDAEVEPLIALQSDVEKTFAGSPAKADALIGAAGSSVPAGISKHEFAAWIVVANAILNLDEFLTRN